ncbi:TonB-dependent receptor plug domain-containing protein [Segatella copri]|uniref:TonB-dependent receptor plug domain-containing protein n=2 Tax=Segatella copri TaxID=165179 RepID=UPI00294B37CC|nr:TonB-dependent receptor [Segatella copri]
MKLIICVLLFVLNSSNVCLGQDSIRIDTVKSVTLNEVVVKAKKHNLYSDVYYINPDIRKGTMSVYDLLAKLPGVDYNKLANAISVYSDAKVIIEVNGVPASKDYLQALAPTDVAKIEVVRLPSARYKMLGYHYTIRIALKDDYKGSAISINNFTIVSPENGNNIIANEQPNMRYLYSNKNIDFNAGYGMATIHWNYPVAYSKQYAGVVTQKIFDTFEDEPNEHKGNVTHNVAANLNWRIGKKQQIALSGNYEWNSNFDEQKYTGTQWLSTGKIASIDEQNAESLKSSDIKSYVIYKNSMLDKLNVYASLGVEYLSGKQRNTFLENGLLTSSLYSKNSKRYIHGEFDAKSQMTDALSFNFGYIGSFCKYEVSDAEQRLSLLENANNHQVFYTYFDYKMSERLLAHLGTGLGYVSQTGMETNWKKWILLPQVSVSFVPNDNMQLSLDYQTTVAAPKLYQLSTNKTSVDTWLKSQGNPSLKASTSHSFSIMGTFWDKLQVGGLYEYEHNSIEQLYNKETDNTYVQTFANANKKGFGLWVSYSWDILKNLTWENTISGQILKVYLDRLNNKCSNLSYLSTLSWWSDKMRTNFSLEYRHQMIKNPLLDGWEHYGQDLWQAAVNKMFWKNRVSVSLMYIPPFRFGIRREQKSVISTDFMDIQKRQSMRTYDNTLLLRVRFRLDNRKKTHRNEYKELFMDENKKGKGLL